MGDHAFTITQKHTTKRIAVYVKLLQEIMDDIGDNETPYGINSEHRKAIKEKCDSIIQNAEKLRNSIKLIA